MNTSSYQYLLTYFLCLCCYGLAVISAPAQVVNFSANDSTVCTNSDLTFYNLTQGASTEAVYYWEFGELASPASSDEAGSVTVSYETPGKKTVTLTLTDKGETYRIEQDFITVLAPPLAYAGRDTVLNYKFDYELNARILSSGESGIWELFEGSGIVTNPNQSKTLVRNLGIGTNVFRWTVSNEACPSSFDYVTLVVNDLKVPGFLSPNGDGKNDYFFLEGIESLGTVEFIVFDRRGVEMYRNNAYNNEWRGTDQRGQLLPNGTYFYSIKASARRQPFSGFFVINK
ncbi:MULTISPECIES: gliding motility-associated C-terminal domain-containing protein [unclassified Carboxylicivirga]|uniref:T9SS type B sorting domain-containing protein n=1 Tax=Carboxylicivirga TaxID=1628153 RepID=UPI003D34D4FA